jgi:hypothetical protein
MKTGIAKGGMGEEENPLQPHAACLLVVHTCLAMAPIFSSPLTRRRHGRLSMTDGRVEQQNPGGVLKVYATVCLCVGVCVRACACVCVHVRVFVRVCVCACVYGGGGGPLLAGAASPWPCTQ